MSHELVGLSAEELEKHYYTQDKDLVDVLSEIPGRGPGLA
ncbi:hypothetical protein FACS1894147_13090 [Spirochaetia bacterium]|nr:hypothetical protein FACS1894147_13090 [Spirochaetia bacterium]